MHNRCPEAAFFGKHWEYLGAVFFLKEPYLSFSGSIEYIEEEWGSNLIFKKSLTNEFYISNELAIIIKISFGTTFSNSRSSEYQKVKSLMQNKNCRCCKSVTKAENGANTQQVKPQE